MPRDLDDALRELADGPIPPLDTPGIVRAGRRRRRLTQATLGVLMIALVVGAVLALERFRPTTPPIVGTVEEAPTTSIGSSASRQTDAGYAAVRLAVLPNRVPAGRLPDTVLVNDGAVSLYATPQCAVDRWNGDGWQDLGQDRFSRPRQIRSGLPDLWGSCLADTEHSDLGPGRYRVRWQVTAGGRRLDNPRLVVAGEFELVDTPRVDTFEDLPTSAEPVDPDSLPSPALAEAMGLLDAEQPFVLPVTGSDLEVYVSARETEWPVMGATSCDVLASVPLRDGWSGVCLERTFDNQRIHGRFPYGTTSIGSLPSAAPQEDGEPGTAACTGQPVPEFDGVPHGWEPLSAPPATRARPAVAWTGDQLLIVGGDTNYAGRHHRDAFVLEPSTGRWACADDAPFDAGAGDAVWTGERLLLYGNDQAAAYDPSTGAWDQLPPPPTDAPHEPFANVWAGDKWIVWGTTSLRATHGRGVAFDPASGEWQAIAPAPLALDQGNGVWTGHELVVFGADLDDNNHSNTPQAVGAAYDPITDSWRRLPPVGLSPQAAGVARTVDGDVLAYDYEMRAALYHPEEDRWEQLDRVSAEFGECYPRSATLEDGSVFLWYCGQAALFDPNAKAFDRVETPITTHWGRRAAEGEVETIAGILVATDGTVYFVGSAHEGHAGGTWRWQPAR